MKKLLLILLLPLTALQAQDYQRYHQAIIDIEKLIVIEDYTEALNQLQLLSEEYDFMFVKHHKITAQLAMYLDKPDVAQHHVQKGIEGGWNLKQIKKTQSLDGLRQDPLRWQEITDNYEQLHNVFIARTDQELKEVVHDMYKQDQWLALKALTKVSENQFDKYMYRKFAPLSEQHMARLNEMLNTDGYPGEKVVGKEMWMMDMLLHHVSMTQQYTKEDTIFQYLTPKLKTAIAKGEMSPYSYALAYDWYTAVLSGHTDNSFGYVNELNLYDIPKSDQLRADLGLRSIATRHGLDEIERKTGMNLYLGPKVRFNKEKEFAGLVESRATERPFD